METITSRDNAKIKYACAVRDTEKQRAADGVAQLLYRTAYHLYSAFLASMESSTIFSHRSA